MVSLSKRKIIFLLLGVFLLLLFILNKILPDTTVVQRENPEYKSLKLGISSRQEVINSLGEPLGVIKKSTGEVLEYKSSNPNFNNEVELVNDKVLFIKEIVTPADNRSTSTLIDKYGVAPYSLYGPRSGVGFKLYIYPEKGIAYIGHSASGSLLEVWYFVPMSFEDFKNRLAIGYSETQQVVQ